MFCTIPKTVKMMSICSIFLENVDISLGAKGLYAMLFYMNKNISSLDDIVEYSNTSKEDTIKYYDELVNAGFIVISNTRNGMKVELKREPARLKQIEESKELSEESKELVNEEKTTSKYEKIEKIIKAYDLPDNVKNLLVSYFEKWLNKRDSFEKAPELHSYIVMEVINKFIALELSEADMIKSIRKSTEKGWHNFYNPNEGRMSNSTTSMFDKNSLESGTWTLEDREKARKRAEELQNSGAKGYF